MDGSLLLDTDGWTRTSVWVTLYARAPDQPADLHRYLTSIRELADRFFTDRVNHTIGYYNFFTNRDIIPPYPSLSAFAYLDFCVNATQRRHVTPVPLPALLLPNIKLLLSHRYIDFHEKDARYNHLSNFAISSDPIVALDQIPF